MKDEKYPLEKRAYFFGQYTYSGSLTFPTDIDILTIRFRPLGIPKLTGINMEYIANGGVAVEDVWFKDFESLYDQMLSAHSIEKAVDILEKYLIAKKNSIVLSNRKNHILNALDTIWKRQGNVRIKELQYHANVSIKTLERTFTDHIGIMPKQYSRLVRYNAVKNFFNRHSEINDLNAVALHFGYFDCSHLISEFKEYSGFTPKEFYKTTLFDNIVIEHE